MRTVTVLYQSIRSRRWLSWLKHLPSSASVVKIVGSIPLQFTNYWALAPQVCPDLPTNCEQTGAGHSSLAMKALYFSVLGQRQNL